MIAVTVACHPLVQICGYGAVQKHACTFTGSVKQRREDHRHKRNSRRPVGQVHLMTTAPFADYETRWALEPVSKLVQAKELGRRGDRLAEKLDPAPIVLDRLPSHHSNFCPRPRGRPVSSLPPTRTGIASPTATLEASPPPPPPETNFNFGLCGLPRCFYLCV